MQIVNAIISAGAAGVTALSSLPRIIKYPAFVGLAIFSVAEITEQANKAWFSNSTYGGQAAQAEGQIQDLKKTIADLKAGREVTAAKQMMAAQVQTQEADSAFLSVRMLGAVIQTLF